MPRSDRGFAFSFPSHGRRKEKGEEQREKREKQRKGLPVSLTVGGEETFGERIFLARVALFSRSNFVEKSKFVRE